MIRRNLALVLPLAGACGGGSPITVPDAGGPDAPLSCGAGMHAENGACVPDDAMSPPRPETFASICQAELGNPNELERESMESFVFEWARLGVAGCDNIGAYLEGQDTLAFTYEADAREDTAGMIRFRPWLIGNGVVRALAVLPRLKSLTLELMPLVGDLSPLGSSPALTELHVAGCAATDFSFVSKANLLTLSVRSEKVESLAPLQHEAQMLGLGLDDTQTPDLAPIAGLIQLRTLVVTRNQVIDATPIAGMVQLTQLSLNDNKIADLTPLAGLINLTMLGLRNNKPASLAPLAGLTKLATLTLTGTAITDIDVIRNFKGMKTLAIDDNPIASFAPLEDLGALTSLNLNRTGISDLVAIKANTRLESLFLGGNPLTDLSQLKQLPALRVVAVQSVVARAPLDIATLASLTQLTSLAISGDQLATLDVVAPLTRLTALVANDNTIEDVSPVAALTQLTRLELNTNRITSLDALAPLQGLITFDAGANPIDPAHCPVAPAARSKVLSDFCTMLMQ